MQNVDFDKQLIGVSAEQRVAYPLWACLYPHNRLNEPIECPVPAKLHVDRRFRATGLVISNYMRVCYG